MTGVEFHFNAPDKIAYVCRLLRKAVKKGSKVVVTGSAEVLGELDIRLWTFDALDFIGHCDASAPEFVLAASPVVLATAVRATQHHDVLVNLGAQVPDGFERFQRLIEVVSADEGDRIDARGRWIHYKGRGYELKRVDLELKESA